MTGLFQQSGKAIGQPSFLQAFHPPHFDVTVSMEGRTAVVVITGELDPATVGQVREALAGVEGRADEFVFDLSGVSFMDLAGLKPFVEQYRRDGRPSVSSPSRIVQSLLTAAGLGSMQIPEVAPQSSAQSPVSQVQPRQSVSRTSDGHRTLFEAG